MGASLSLCPLGQARRIQAVTRTRIFFELRPELVDFQALAHTLPKLLRSIFQSGLRRGRGLRGGHGE